MALDHDDFGLNQSKNDRGRFGKLRAGMLAENGVALFPVMSPLASG
jgi:hypothetical protein